MYYSTECHLYKYDDFKDLIIIIEKKMVTM